MSASKTSAGSRQLSEEISKRNLSYQDVSAELLKGGADIQRYSVWQWAHGRSRPNLRNAFALELTLGIPAKSWNEEPGKVVEKKSKGKKS